MFVFNRIKIYFYITNTIPLLPFGRFTRCRNIETFILTFILLIYSYNISFQVNRYLCTIEAEKQRRVLKIGIPWKKCTNERQAVDIYE